MAWLTRTEITHLGFAAVGENVYLSNKASFYNCANIEIADNVRVDDFCVLSAGKGGISIGRNVHIAVYSLLIGSGRITLADFCNLSSRVSIYSSNDDYSGTALTNPTVPPEYTNVYHADVVLEKHTIIGSGSIVLPGITLREGTAVGALSLVTQDCDAFGIYAGIPARIIGSRSRDLLDREKEFLSDLERVVGHG